MPPTSGPELSDAQVYELLSPSIRKYIHKAGWTEIRPLQLAAIKSIMNPHRFPGVKSRDVILSAATAGGKTEAAFLPIFSLLEEERHPTPGVKVLCLSPLKALINDQYDRLLAMGMAANVPVHRRHGDVSAAEKAKVFRQPDGILLTTPESLEALFVRRGREMGTLLSGLQYIVIDELHVFIGSERGKQLQNLMHRVELAIRKAPIRVALSATLGDLDAAARYLRPGDGSFLTDRLIASGDETDLLLQIKGYRTAIPKPGQEEDAALSKIAAHLFDKLRGKTNLAFANSRSRVESLANHLRTQCEQIGVPVEFFPHHGNLSKHLRETVEQRLKSDQPTTAVCTSTLELGIDIGSVHTVAQVTPPHGVASLRQRLGRSGRRQGESAILRMYVEQPALEPNSDLGTRLRLGLIQSIAIVELLLERWYEPEREKAMHLSTLVQQIISTVVQHGGASAKELYGSMCAYGPFRSVDPETFQLVLRSLGRHEVLMQSTNGTLLLAKVGERISAHYTFYAAFETDREYTVINKGKKLGSLPVSVLLKPGDHIVFGGRNWKIQDINLDNLQIIVGRSTGSSPINFGGQVGQLHGGVVQKMYEVLASSEEYVYLDDMAQLLLKEARETFSSLDLVTTQLCAADGKTVLLPWLGDAALESLTLVLRQMNLDAVQNERFIEISNTTPAKMLKVLSQLASCEVPEVADIVPRDGTLQSEKFHYLLCPEALARDYASLRLNADDAWN